MKNNRYNSNYVPGEKYEHGYWRFFIDSDRYIFAILTFIFGLLCCAGSVDETTSGWIHLSLANYKTAGWLYLSFIPFIVICIMNYTAWRERQQGKSS